MLSHKMPAVDVTFDGDVCRVAVLGTLDDYEDVGGLLQAVRPIWREPEIRCVVVDLSGVHDVGALGVSGLQVLHLTATVHDKRYLVIVGQPLLRSVLGRSGVPIMPGDPA